MCSAQVGVRLRGVQESDHRRALRRSFLPPLQPDESLFLLFVFAHRSTSLSHPCTLPQYSSLAVCWDLVTDELYLSSYRQQIHIHLRSSHSSSPSQFVCCVIQTSSFSICLLVLRYTLYILHHQPASCAFMSRRSTSRKRSAAAA
jgi:hypothetical protein